MLTTAVLTLALAAASLAQVPEGYRTVYMTSAQDTKFVVVPKSRTAGATLVVYAPLSPPKEQHPKLTSPAPSSQSLTSSQTQTWYLAAPSNSTSIQLASTTLCMDAGPRSAWKDMAPISLRECVAGAEAQTWNAMADGRIALAASSGTKQCVDLQYLRAVENNPVGLYNCAGLGNTGARDKGINWPLVDAGVF
ncbi:carbohydrate-binding module family 13 protein [Stemphylium lycopersici]|uniref:Carbohydrate-binding module family 13 protein n=1 Tax=Stemphylium lycopersici TaxID=183478 RepID=A0A364MSW2_STELY|nr:carbohydrate-binding module family 13 protein [Stemphylium lycopersici]RAR02085.1 carbohydrate-binding module family 13 protein [Stemphylium lycopersici]